MSMHATVYGRCAFDPRQHTTRANKPMTTCRLAVDATGHNADEQQTLWFDVLAFGRNAESLADVSKGQMVSAMGKVTRSVYTAKTGEEREQLTLLADAIVTARSGRPGGRRQSNQSNNGPNESANYGASGRMQEPPPFDDEMVF